MRYGILGDIHGNLSALETVLAALADDGVDQVVSVGDVVGYGAAPAECIEMLRECGALVVKGNHDAACIGQLDDRYFNNYAREAVRWTRGVLDRRDTDWLTELPLTLNLEHCQVSHGSLYRPEEFSYVQVASDADPSLDIMERPVCFVGHTHVPITLVRLADDSPRTGYYQLQDDAIHLADLWRSLVNVGSVGQPRDEDRRTGYALFDSDRQTVWMRRLEYDIDREAARIRAAGLPAMLADRLFLGV